MSDPVCVSFRVRGKVQGVFYRSATQATALQLGLTGWVRNCPDGDVELVACGRPAQLEALEQWLWLGPPAAQVRSVQRQEAPLQGFADFAVRY
jgi:acylphosphatase